jgi:hypothetical protein
LKEKNHHNNRRVKKGKSENSNALLLALPSSGAPACGGATYPVRG